MSSDGGFSDYASTGRLSERMRDQYADRIIKQYAKNTTKFLEKRCEYCQYSG